MRVDPTKTIVGSPQYEWGINPHYNYFQVAIEHYKYVGQGFSTTYALNKMADTIYGTEMAQSRLNGWLLVYGNTNVGLPPTPPYYATSATPSQTGNGYVNNPNNILGAPDASYTYLNSGSYGNKAEITAKISNCSYKWSTLCQMLHTLTQWR
ncbi:MAG: hypothetical protein LBE76_01700 [Nitrososphaerota archaeon]|nr:hypothetical protein [Nitrososphaerota archaeon]